MDSQDLIKLRYFYCSGKLRVKNIRLFTRSKDRNEEAYQTVLNAFMFPLRGRADICLDNQRFAASEGTLIYATSGHKIGFKVKSAEDFVYFNIYHNDVYDKNFCVSLSDYGAYIHDIQTYLAETAADELREYFIRERFLSSVFKKLFKLEEFTDFRQFGIIEKAEHYLSENFREAISLGDIASALHVSANSISYLYKKYRNETIKNRIIELRLKKAIDLIAHNNYSIKKAALEVGFNDPLYFSRLFKSKIGYSPNELRKI